MLEYGWCQSYHKIENLWCWSSSKREQSFIGSIWWTLREQKSQNTKRTHSDYSMRRRAHWARLLQRQLENQVSEWYFGHNQKWIEDGSLVHSQLETDSCKDWSGYAQQFSSQWLVIELTYLILFENKF